MKLIRELFYDVKLDTCSPTWHYENAIEFGEKKQNKGYHAIQGHQGRYQSKADIKIINIILLLLLSTFVQCIFGRMPHMRYASSY